MTFSSIFPYGTIAHWVSGTGFVATLWLGVYIATHVPRRPHSRLAYLSIFAMAGYFLHTSLCLFVPAEQAGYLWRRYLGWFALAPLPIWLHLTSRLRCVAAQKRQRIPIWLSYAAGLVLAITWVTGDWSFTRETIMPPELVIPISLYALIVGTIGLSNVNRLRKRAADETLRVRQTFLGVVILLLMASILYWPVTVSLLDTSWSPITRLAIGDSIPLLAVMVLAYSIAFQNMFMSGRWLKQDFFYQGISVFIIGALYVLAMWGAYRIALTFGLNVPTLVIISVVGLTIFTHLISQRFRELWSGVIFKQLPSMRQELIYLVSNSYNSRDSIQGQMSVIVNRLKEFTGASSVCVALMEGNERLIVRTSTNPSQLGKEIPYSTANGIPSIGFHDPENSAYSVEDRELLDCVVLIEPIQVEGEVTGYIMLGDRGAGEGYEKQEKLWVSGLAAHLGAAFEKEEQLKETADLIAELKADALELQEQRKILEQELEQVMADPSPRVSRKDLREAIYAYGHPDKMKEILTREDNTMNTVLYLNGKDLPADEALRQQLGIALEEILPSDGLPPLDSFQERDISAKRPHLPAPVANYYTLHLVMSGYTHEYIAEKLVISTRQVRNYLDRAISQVKVCLENAVRERAAQENKNRLDEVVLKSMQKERNTEISNLN